MDPKNQIHDFHPPISPSGLYWVVPVPTGGLVLGPDGREATLELRAVAAVDQPRWPAIDAVGVTARMNIRLTFTATDEAVTYDDPQKHFRVTGWRAKCQLAADVHVPATGFSWKSDPLEQSQCDFAIMGQEVNGRYYDASGTAS